MIDLFLTSLIAIIFFVYFYYWIKAFIISAPYYPSSGKISKKIIEEYKKRNVKNIVELGAGDGKIAMLFSKNGFNVTAVEINPVLVMIIWLRKIITGNKNLKIQRKDFLKMSFEEFDGAYIYLYPKVMDKLANKLYKDMPKNSVIISNTFTFHSKTPIQTYKELKLSIYEVE